MATAKNDPTVKEIWATLSSIDVSEHTKKRNDMTYLSWAWAWGIMMDHYPQFEVEWHGENESAIDGKNPDVFYYTGGTAMVGCTVTIGAVSRDMFLPVMTGFQNKAVANPDTRAIGDAKMRCLVKCFGILGLGHYIYAGEDLPPQGVPDEVMKQKAAPAKPRAPIEEGDGLEAEMIEAEIKTLGKQMKGEGIGLGITVRDDVKKALASKEVGDLRDALAAMKKLQSPSEEK
jgi:hypothetical protein